MAAGNAIAAAVGAGACLVASPYLARLTVAAADRANRAWWRGVPVGPGRRRAAALTGLLLGALAGLAAGWGATLPAFIALALIATPLALIDIETHRLPDRLTLPAAVAAAVLLALAAAVRDDWHPYVRAIAAAAVVFAIFFAVTFAVPSGFGFGDVKLSAVLGAYLGFAGWRWVYYGILGGFLLGTVIALILLASGRADRKTPIAFGPALIAGALAVLALRATTSLLN